MHGVPEICAFLFRLYRCCTEHMCCQHVSKMLPLSGRDGNSLAGLTSAPSTDASSHPTTPSASSTPTILIQVIRTLALYRGKPRSNFTVVMEIGTYYYLNLDSFAYLFRSVCVEQWPSKESHKERPWAQAGPGPGLGEHLPLSTCLARP